MCCLFGGPRVRRFAASAVSVVLGTICLCNLAALPAGASSPERPAFNPNYGQGYWQMTTYGNIYNEGDAGFYGPSPWNSLYNGYTFVSMAPSADSNGYALMDDIGQVYAYGDQDYEGGSPSGYTGSFVSIVMTSNGLGYWLLDSTGQVYTYGNANYYGGSPGGYTGSFVSMQPSADGGGYALVDSTGQVYTYGDQGYFGGSPSGQTSINTIMMLPGTGLGYWLVSSQGGVFTYSYDNDSANFWGSVGNVSDLPYPIISGAVTTDGDGYRLSGSDGGVFDYGDAQGDGSALDSAAEPPPPGSIVAIATAH